MYNISLKADFLITISKKARAAQLLLNLAAVSRRDLSYETDSGPKTKPLKTVIWDPASYFLSSYFMISHPASYFVYRHICFFNFVGPVLSFNCF